MKSIVAHIIFLFLVIVPMKMTMGQNQMIDPTIKKVQINIFPNPVQDEFQISHPEIVKSISINSIAGKEVRRFKVRGNSTFSIDDLSKGIYIVRLFDHKDEPIKVLRLNKA